MESTRWPNQSEVESGQGEFPASLDTYRANDRHAGSGVVAKEKPNQLI